MKRLVAVARVIAAIVAMSTESSQARSHGSGPGPSPGHASGHFAGQRGFAGGSGFVGHQGIPWSQVPRTRPATIPATYIHRPCTRRHRFTTTAQAMAPITRTCRVAPSRGCPCRRS